MLSPVADECAVDPAVADECAVDPAVVGECAGVAAAPSVPRPAGTGAGTKGAIRR